uniref:HtaA domain-containing protein n=1 Tax=Demequina sp. NBRC 110056 TaxID=1570345 RepID=UPI00190E8F2C
TDVTETETGASVEISGVLPAELMGSDYSTTPPSPALRPTALYGMWCIEGEGRLSGDACDSSQQTLLLQTPSYGYPGLGTVTDGVWTFTTTIDVTNQVGDTVCAEVGDTQCGLFFRLNHEFPGNTTYDSFHPITFTAPEPEVPVGDLQWGIYSQFTNYITGPIAKGDVTTSGATASAGVFGFTQSGGDANANTRTGTAQYAGAVRFTGHEGDLDMTFADPYVRFTGTTTAVLTLKVNGTRVDFANLALGGGLSTSSEGATTWTGVPATLLSSGASAFNGFYPAGTAIDPVTFTVGASDSSAGGGDTGTGGTDGSGGNGGNGGTGNGGSGNGNGGAGTGGSSSGGDTGTSTDNGSVVGRLTWAIDTAFRNYVTGPIAEGTVSVSGASASGGTYTFLQTGGSADPATGTGTATYGGSVLFSGHHGDLSLRFANPQVRLTGTNSAVISLAVNGSRVDFATVNLGAGNRTTLDNAVRYSGAPATLTAAGARAFNGFYSAGRALAPVTVTFGVAAPAGSGGGGTTVVASAVNSSTDSAIPDTPPATTGIVLDDETLERLLAGETVTIEVDGFQPNETGIAVVIYSTPTVLATDIQANAQGVASWTGALPASLVGEHTLTFQGSVDKGIVLNIPDRSALEGMCLVEGATLDWGFKESFRAYIESSIANGEWVLDGVTEEGGIFSWVDGGGAIDPETLLGTVDYTGSVRFTGHEGALDTTIANPVIELSADGAYLLLDVSGTTQGGDAVTEEAVRFAELELDAATISAEGDIVTIADVPAVLTEAGSVAFGTYPAGDALDALTVTLGSADGCVLALAGQTVEEPEEEVSETPSAEPTPEASPEVAEAVEESDSSSWWIWAVVALAVIGAATAAIVAVRRRS